jgi:O-acetyl-ADP-ribose deacetylase
MNYTIEIMQGDITKMEVDAIVNAANRSLLGGGGVDGAIHRAAGPQLLDECRTLGCCPTGEAKITKGYNLPARYVIHTVGPVWTGGSNHEPELLRNCYMNSLRIAAEYKLGSVAFPNISTGIYGFPKELAAQIAMDTVKEWLTANQSPSKVMLVCYDDENFKIYKELNS